jgi:hypothetical protein
VGVDRLETFARNLDISDAARTDLLNSVPTPWARLLLFESALYDPQHPAHPDVVDQWRGLLGLVALHDVLRLPFDASRRVNLRELRGGVPVRDAFVQLRPRHVIDGHDEEEEKWHYFNLISVGGVALGATSPRTLVFTGIAHACPDSVPFITDEGRLSDPAKYYRKFGDETFLGLLARWLDDLIQEAETSPALVELLGSVPAFGRPTSRFAQLMRALTGWRQEFSDVRPLAQWPLARHSHFEGAYSILRPVAVVSHSPLLQQSDLFIRERNDALVFFDRARHSTLVNRMGMEITGDLLRVYDGHWTEANRPLPLSRDFLPALKLLEDPTAFFEDALIQAPLRAATSYSLEFEGRLYLLPYRKEVLDHFTPEEVVRNTSIRRALPNHVAVDLHIPLVNGRAVKATKVYREHDEVLTADTFPAANLAFWPNFICRGRDGEPHWERYFYYKFDQGLTQLDFEPLGAAAGGRQLTNRTWLETREPLAGFVGTVNGRSGLLLIKYEQINPPTRDWKVAVDLGSTHTRAFYLEVVNSDGRWLGVSGDIQAIKIASQVRELTACQPIDLLQNFFVMDQTVGGAATEEFISHLVMPQPTNEDHPDWLPREGLIYQQSLLKGFPANTIKYNFKWNSNTTDYALRAYLRCLLVLIQAEALCEGARVISVSHAYPSVFTSALAQKHRNEWTGLGNYSGLAVEPPLMESEAVGRYLQVEQGAAVSTNTIALDVGGSTTDIAIWASNSLSRQESVKMAAGVAGRYVQTEPGPFKQEFVRILAGQPFSLTPQVSEFESRESGFTLMFNAVLNAMAATGKIDQLVGSIKTSPEGTKLIAHIMFVFGALLYYAGMLGRKVRMTSESQYYVYFCGKGGQLITWINNHELFVREMFSAGLLGTHAAPQPPLDVKPALSVKPKQEVGRGLLAESSLSASLDAAHQGGLINLAPPKVTVGDEGYGTLHWDGELDGETLISLPQQVPAYGSLRELNSFVRAFVDNVSTRDAARLLKLGTQEPRGFGDNLKDRLFGTARGRIVYDLQQHPNEALLESLFITEVKVLLETVTNNPHVFG